MDDHIQHELRELRPGYRGGRARASSTNMAELGRRGGRATVARHGREHMAQLARRGAAARWRMPRTVEVWCGALIRLVAWWPHQPRRQRRRRPEIVRITLQEPPE